MIFASEREETLFHESSHMAVAIMHNLRIGETIFYPRAVEGRLASVFVEDSESAAIEWRISYAPYAVGSIPSDTDILSAGNGMLAQNLAEYNWVMANAPAIQELAGKIVAVLPKCYNATVKIEYVSEYLADRGIGKLDD